MCMNTGLAHTYGRTRATTRASRINSAARQAMSIASLRGEKPADLPVQMPTKYETMLDLSDKHAEALWSGYER